MITSVSIQKLPKLYYSQKPRNFSVVQRSMSRSVQSVGQETVYIEKAASARSRCSAKLGGCGETIASQSLRIKLTIKQDQMNHFVNFSYFYHIKCYLEKLKRQNKHITINDFKGNQKLSMQQQALLKKAINGQFINWTELEFGSNSLHSFLSKTKS